MKIIIFNFRCIRFTFHMQIVCPCGGHQRCPKVWCWGLRHPLPCWTSPGRLCISCTGRWPIWWGRESWQAERGGQVGGMLGHRPTYKGDLDTDTNIIYAVYARIFNTCVVCGNLLYHTISMGGGRKVQQYCPPLDLIEISARNKVSEWLRDYNVLNPDKILTSTILHSSWPLCGI